MPEGIAPVIPIIFVSCSACLIKVSAKTFVYDGIFDFDFACSPVDTLNFDNETSEEPKTTKSGLLVNFFGGFIGSVIGTLTILFLYINEYLPIDLLKLK